jgi:hypothetical protein
MLKPFRRFILTLVAVAAIAALGSTNDAKYQYALIQNSCAPWDGGAIQVTLANEPLQCQGEVHGAHLVLGVWRGLPLHAGQVVKFSPREDNGFASRCKKEDECEAAESGTITFDSVATGKGATGHYEVRFRDGRTITGRFDAKWCEVRELCG